VTKLQLASALSTSDSAQSDPSPKKSLRAIDDQAKKFDQHARKLDEDFWTKNDPEKQARSQSMSDQLSKAIAGLDAAIAQAQGAEKNRAGGGAFDEEGVARHRRTVTFSTAFWLLCCEGV